MVTKQKNIEHELPAQLKQIIIKNVLALTVEGLPLEVPMCLLCLWIQLMCSGEDQGSFSVLHIKRKKIQTTHYMYHV